MSTARLSPARMCVARNPGGLPRTGLKSQRTHEESYQCQFASPEVYAEMLDRAKEVRLPLGNQHFVVADDQRCTGRF